MKRLVYAVCVMLAGSAPAGDGEAFGIRMGQTLAQLDLDRRVGELGYALKSAPDPDPLFAEYRIVATPRAGVCSVVAIARFDNMKNAIRVYNEVQDRLFAAYGPALYQDLSHRTSDETLMWTPRLRTSAVTLTLVRSNPKEKRVTLTVLFANRDACDQSAERR